MHVLRQLVRLCAAKATVHHKVSGVGNKDVLGPRSILDRTDAHG